MNKVFFFLLLFSISSSLVAQNLDGKKAIRPPLSMKAPVSSDAPKAGETRDDKEKYWVVFSDRDKNPYFSDQSLTQKVGDLDFLEPCYVLEEKDNVLKLVRWQTDPMAIETDNKVAVFTKAAVELGWMDKSKLLLSKRSLIDAETNYSEKAVTVTKLGQLANPQAYFRDGLIDLYKTPNIVSNARSDEEIKMFQYLFIYKRQNNMLLIGKTNSVRPGDVNSLIVGWTPENQVYYWKNALCLRINFDQNEEEIRKKNQTPVGFFQSPDSAKKYQIGGKVEPLPFEYKDPSIEENRKDNPYLLGYPILNKEGELEKGIYKTGYITNTLDEKGKSIFDVLQQAEFDQKNVSGENDFEKVNVFFVFDGSKREILKTVAEAIHANSSLSNDKNNTNRYHWNGIIYNQADCEKEIEMICSTPAGTDDKDEFEDQLIKFSQMPACSSIDRDANGSPVFKAITTACKLFPKATQSNVLIITGTTTDVKNPIADAQKAMNDKIVNTFFIQLQNKNGSLYDKYKTDMRDMIINVSATADNGPLKGFTGKDFRKVSWKQDKDDFNLINSIRLGTFYSKEDNVFTSKELKNYLSDFFRKNDRFIDDVKNMYKNTNKELNKPTTAESEQDLSKKKGFYFFLKNNNKLTDDEIKRMVNQKNFQCFIEAYTTYNHINLSEPFFNKSLFLSNSEFDRLYKSLEDLTKDANSTEERRTRILSSYKSIIQNYKGGVFNDEDNKMGLEAFWKLISGMPSNNTLFKKYKLTDIQNTSKVGKEDIDKIYDGLNNIYKKLKKVKSGTSYSKIEIGDNEFYWVTEEDFQFN